jgi:DNA topoisomerase-1
MNKKLIIVESPSKAKTIASYVSNDVIVLSSKGHIRDLSTQGVGGLGIDIKNEYLPIYSIIKGKAPLVKELQTKAKGRDVLLATDPDREGEAIAWHLAQVLELKPESTNRIVFREITKPAITEALLHPRPIDQHLVFSQEVRRILDRIIGFKLSKLLQSKIKSKSAGRVQSVALKLIVDLEKEIEAFIPEIYYEIEATFPHFTADYIIESKRRLTQEEAEKIVSESNHPFKVAHIDQKVSKSQPKPPLITSTLQQDAINQLRMSANKAMSVAQALYEGKQINGEIVGLITYMRTDSTRMADTFVDDLHGWIVNHFGKEYLGKYKTQKSEHAQDAHEAIRPTSLNRTPESVEPYLTKEELKLYKLIYHRTVASLMAPALFDQTKVTLEVNHHLYSAEGSVLKFDGYQKVYQESKNKDKRLPKLEVGQMITASQVVSNRKETSPKTRFSEATLIKELESVGIGRPSTYAQIIQTLKQRDYVKLEDKRFQPTEQGRLTSEQLDLFFHKIINVEYTSNMEHVLDEIADGKQNGGVLIEKFYQSFIPMVDVANQEMKKIGPKKTDELCPLCGKPLVIRKSRYGEFVACSGFPRCKFVKK